MKSFLLFLFFAIFTLGGCTKSHEENSGKFDKNIIGKWNYTQRFYSIGGPQIYESTTHLRQWINFDNTGKLSSNTSSFRSFNNYYITDSVTMKLTSGIQPGRIYFYKIDSVKHYLTLSPADYICIEGCGDIFQR